MKKKINYRDKIIWDNCEELYDKIFKYKIKEDYNFYKSSFCKVMTIKLGNSKTFLELLKEKKNSKKIFYFRRNDEFQVSKLYAEKKNIVVKKYKLNYSILIYKIVNFFLENLTYENNYKKNTILFVRNRTKYQKIFDMCASTMNKKYNFIYYNNILKILTSHKLKFQAKKKTDLEKKLLISNLEGIYGILIIKKLLNNYLSEIKPKAIISVEGDSLEHSVMAYISKNKYKTYCFQWGSFVKKNDIKNGFKYMYQDKKFVWGPYYKKKFQEINSDTNFIVAGNSLIKENYNSKKKDIVFLLNPNTPYIDDKTNKDFLHLVKWSKKFKDKNVIIRFHPSDNEIKINRYKLNLKRYNYLYHEHKYYSLEDSLINACVVISIRSSALIEATRSGVIPIILNDSEPDLEEFFDDIKKIGLCSNNIKTIKKCMDSILLEKNDKLKINFQKKIKNIGKKYITNISQKSLNIIKKELISI
jgi:hypothetical protein